MKHSRSKEVRSRSPFNTHAAQNGTSDDFSVDLVRSLLPLTLRAEREARGQFLLEGLRCVHLALETDCLETLLFAFDAPFATLEVVRAAREAGVRCVAVEAASLAPLAQGEDPQGLVGVGARRTLSLDEAFAAEGAWVALESVQKHGNLGSILRTAEASGARGIIAVGAQIDFFAPGVVRASMGAFFAQKLVRAGWNELLDFKHRHQIVWMGTSCEAATPYDTLPFPRDFWLWMGDEQSGLSARALDACDERLQIPMQGRVDSLNLAVATAIVLYGAKRSHK